MRISLRPCYGESSTDILHAGTAETELFRLSGATPPIQLRTAPNTNNTSYTTLVPLYRMLLRARYEMPSTDCAYSATRGPRIRRAAGWGPWYRKSCASSSSTVPPYAPPTQSPLLSYGLTARICCEIARICAVRY
eukprot:2526111-Rhodomonas_salina.1